MDNSQTCFCDSIFENKRSDTMKEYICYKGKRVYKLQQWQNRQSISRHSLADNRWLYENLECTGDNVILQNERQYFLSTQIQNDSIKLTYNNDPVDSMRIVLERNNDTLFSHIYFDNSATFGKKLFTDSSDFIISVFAYTHDSLPHPETKIKDRIKIMNSISYRTEYLVNNSLDKVLLKFRNCLDTQKPK